MILEMLHELVLGISALNFELAIFAPIVSVNERALRRLNDFGFERFRND